MAGLLDGGQWAEHQKFGAGFGGFEALLTELFEQVFGVIGSNFFPALGVQGMPAAGKEQAEIIVDLGGGPHRGARIAG